jgi:hypothetical protein
MGKSSGQKLKSVCKEPKERWDFWLSEQPLDSWIFLIVDSDYQSHFGIQLLEYIYKND